MDCIDVALAQKSCREWPSGLFPNPRNDQHTAEEGVNDESHFAISVMRLLEFERTTGPPEVGQ